VTAAWWGALGLGWAAAHPVTILITTALAAAVATFAALALHLTEEDEPPMNVPGPPRRAPAGGPGTTPFPQPGPLDYAPTEPLTWWLSDDTIARGERAVK
jgi:hypothetical protein